jgi:hypothetical protein
VDVRQAVVVAFAAGSEDGDGRRQGKEEIRKRRWEARTGPS